MLTKSTILKTMATSGCEASAGIRMALGVLPTCAEDLWRCGSACKRLKEAIKGVVRGSGPSTSSASASASAHFGLFGRWNVPSAALGLLTQAHQTSLSVDIDLAVSL